MKKLLTPASSSTASHPSIHTEKVMSAISHNSNPAEIDEDSPKKTVPNRVWVSCATPSSRVALDAATEETYDENELPSDAPDQEALYLARAEEAQAAEELRNAGPRKKRDICVLLAPLLPGLHRLYLKRNTIGYVQIALWLLGILDLVLLIVFNKNELILPIAVCASPILMAAPAIWLWAYIEAHVLKVDGFDRPILPGSWWRRLGWRFFIIIPVIWLLNMLSASIPALYPCFEVITVLSLVSICVLGVIGFIGMLVACESSQHKLFNNISDLYLSTLLTAIHIGGVIVIFCVIRNGGSSQHLQIGFGSFLLCLVCLWFMHKKVNPGIPLFDNLVLFCARVFVLTSSILTSLMIVGATLSLKDELKKAGSTAQVRTGAALQNDWKHVLLRGKFQNVESIVAAATLLGGFIYLGKKLWICIQATTRTCSPRMGIFSYGMACVACVLVIIMAASPVLEMSNSDNPHPIKQECKVSDEEDEIAEDENVEETSPAQVILTPAEEVISTKTSIEPQPDSPSPQVQTIDYARPSQVGIEVSCSYDAAMMSQQTEDDEEPGPYTPITFNSDEVSFSTVLGALYTNRFFKTYTGGADRNVPSLTKFEKTGPNQLTLHVMRLMIPNQIAADKLQQVITDIDQLSKTQIEQALGNYLLDDYEVISITLTSPTEGRATSILKSGWNVVKISNIAVKLSEGSEPDGIIHAEEDVSDEARGSIFDMNFESDVDDFISTLRAARLRSKDAQLFQKRLLTLLPLIKESRDVNLTLPETKGNTALHYACGLGYYELVDWLLNLGADVHKQTNRGATPMQCIGPDPQGRIRARLKERL